MTQEPKRKPRPTGEEGALLTKRIADEVKRLRGALDWSAERLGEEMSAVGVPWTRDVVVNLETGRRKTLAVHELLALAWVLDADPVELIVPQGDRLEKVAVPVTPAILVSPVSVRSWFRDKMGSLRAFLDERASETEAEYEDSIRDAVANAYAREPPPHDMPQEEMVRQILDGLRERRGGKLVPDLVTYLPPVQAEAGGNGQD